MAFRLNRGKTKMMWFKKGDTTHAIRDGGLVKINDSSDVIPVANDSTDAAIGISRINVALTDTSSWTNAPMVPVEVPVELAVEWDIDVDSDAGASASDVGHYCGVDTTGGASVLAGDSCGMRVDVSDTVCRQILVTGFVSASKIRGVITKTAFVRGLQNDTNDTSA